MIVGFHKSLSLILLNGLKMSRKRLHAVITVRVSINKQLMGKVIYLILFTMSAM